jgi:hypothetical protein
MENAIPFNLVSCTLAERGGNLRAWTFAKWPEMDGFSKIGLNDRKGASGDLTGYCSS